VGSPLPATSEEDTAAGAEEAARVVSEFKALRLRRGLSQRAAAAEVRAGGGPAAAELQTVDPGSSSAPSAAPP
jgi:hypothetical protein